MLLRVIVGLLWTPMLVASSAIADDQWIQLFNGKDLDGWTVKIKSHDVGVNYGDTFRVKDGLLKVSYDQYEGPFRGRFGHLFYKTPFSHYVLRVEYRIVGEQYLKAPGWAIRNSGVMIHGQTAESMEKNQDFPVCAEVQLLGGNGKDPRTTANLCTPGTNVVMNGELNLDHCTQSKSKTYHGDQWVTVEVEARGNGTIRHKIDGVTVFEYSQVQLDERDKYAQALLDAGAEKMVSGGTISLQSEGHPIEFRKVELRKLAE
ncbi:MAG: 3-keto-disaccharide hydrolase [Bythopirellula sp.]